MTRHYDLVVIGTGPAGQKAAVQAAKLGKRVLAIEKGGRVGGVCVHSGTIPSKALREAVLLLAGLRERRVRGVRVTLTETLGIEELLAHTESIVATETAIVRDQLHRNGVELVYGTAQFEGPNHVRVVSDHSEGVYTGQRIIIATGALPLRPPEIPFDGDRVLDSETVLSLQRIPKKLVVIGAGVIGVEYACMFAALGSKVVLLDRRRELLKFLDREIVDALSYQLWSKAVHLRLGENLAGVERRGPEVVVRLASGEEVSGDTILYVLGRVAATESLSLEKAGLAAGGGGQLKVDSSFRTEVPHIFAVGDVIGFPSLASTSMEQGRLAACQAFGVSAESFPELLPYGIYTIPEISTVGRSEGDLRREGIPCASGRAHYREIARGQLVGDADGLLKLLFHRETRKLLGVHSIGEGSAELIHIGQAVLAFGGSVDYFVSNVFNYPTFAECYRVAALDGINRLSEPPADEQGPAHGPPFRAHF
jgi:NAD(P) transhydrogenase